MPINGRVHAKQWRIRRPSGDTISENGDMTREFLLLDYFLCSFPDKQTILNLRTTNIKLNFKRKKERNRPEFYKLLGIIILITWFKFTTRASLWSRAPIRKYIPAQNLGMTTSMSRPQFDELWSALLWSEEPKEIPEGMPHAEHWWMLIDDMVEIFNQHGKNNIYLSTPNSIPA